MLFRSQINERRGIDLAIDAFDFEMEDNFRVDYSKNKNQSNEMVSCPYFTTNYLHVSERVVKHNNKDSFIIYICVEGEVIINFSSGEELISKGETILIPATLKDFSLISKNAKLLEVYV